MRFSHFTLNTSHKELMGLFLNQVFEMEIVSYGEFPLFDLKGTLFQLLHSEKTIHSDGVTVRLCVKDQNELDELFQRSNFFVYRELSGKGDDLISIEQNELSLKIVDFDFRNWIIEIGS